MRTAKEPTVAVSKMDKIHSLDSVLTSGADTHFQQNLTTFLQKPIFLRYGTWTNSSTYQMAAMSLPKELFTDSLFLQKISGFFAFRATIVLRLQVNATRFQQGRLIMSYIPQGNVAGMRPYSRTSNLVTLTQLPNVQLDAGSDTEAILEIPYVSPTTHYNLMDGVGPHGAAFLHVYSPLVEVGTSSGVEYTIWASFKDIEIITPTLDQSFSTQAKKNVRHTKANSRRATNRIVDIADEELRSKGVGPIGSVLTMTSSVASSLSAIPMLSSVAAPVSWATNALAGIANHFGWSNPRNEGVAERRMLQMFPYSNNADGVDGAMPLALRSDNKVEVLPGFAGTDIDEMNIKFITSIPAYFSKVDWTTSLPTDSLLTSIPLYPSLGSIPLTDSTINYNARTPVNYISQMFELYRGSIRITFKLVKTEFHSGRLCVAFAPGYTGATPPTIDQTGYLHREIIDIRDGNSFTLTFPYTSVRSFRAITEPYGTAYIYVLNALVAPTTVSSTVPILMEMSGCDDLEFAFPKPLRNCPYIPSSATGTFVTQMNVETMGSNPNSIILDESIGGSSLKLDELSAAKYCIENRFLACCNC
jgi:hypothetical protein